MMGQPACLHRPMRQVRRHPLRTWEHLLMFFRSSPPHQVRVEAQRSLDHILRQRERASTEKATKI